MYVGTRRVLKFEHTKPGADWNPVRQVGALLESVRTRSVQLKEAKKPPLRSRKLRSATTATTVSQCRLALRRAVGSLSGDESADTAVG